MNAVFFATLRREFSEEFCCGLDWPGIRKLSIPVRSCINQSDDRTRPASANYFRIRAYIMRPAGRLIDKVNFDGTSLGEP